ncbi:MAG TPA: hypothetical protein VHY30_03115 [Verrucomicrobiae bacterium]|nr:hypothetical protein [Verrucomicrobiae bacterium]
MTWKTECKNAQRNHSGKLVRIAGFEPAKASFTTLPASGANDVSLPFIARRVAKNPFVCKCFIAISGNLGRKILCNFCAAILLVQKLCKFNVALKSVQILCKLLAAEFTPHVIFVFGFFSRCGF